MMIYGLEELTSMRGASVSSVNAEGTGAVDDIHAAEQTGTAGVDRPQMALSRAKHVISR